jgi:uncharacterized GH25 family protein
MTSLVCTTRCCRRLVVSLTVMAATITLLPTTAAAHEFWIMPAAFATQLGHRAPVQLRVGAGWPGEPHEPQAQRTLRWQWLDAAGAQPLGTGADTAAVTPRAPGWAWVVYRSNHAQITLPADQFESYLLQEGLDHVVQQRRARGQSNQPGREIYSRCAKALIRVDATTANTQIITTDAAARSPQAWLQRPVKLAFEIVPLTNPRLLGQGGQMRFALRLNGKALRGALLKAMPQSAAAGPTLQARSNAAGHVSLPLPLRSAGVWLFNSVHMRRAPTGSGADWESLWSSLTLAVGDVPP